MRREVGLEPHHSALLQLSQFARENEHQSTVAAGWSQSLQESPDELQKQQPSKGWEVGSGGFRRRFRSLDAVALVLPSSTSGRNAAKLVVVVAVAVADPASGQQCPPSQSST